MIDPRDALNLTISSFNLKATDIASKSGLDEQTISRYRRKRKDMTSLTLQKIVLAMPIEARFYFLSLWTAD